MALHGLLLEELVLALSELLLLIDDFLANHALILRPSALLQGLDIARSLALIQRSERPHACTIDGVLLSEVMRKLQVILAVTRLT